MLYVILIIIIIILYRKNSSKADEIEMLKNSNNKVNFCPMCGYDLCHNENNNNNNNNDDNKAIDIDNTSDYYNSESIDMINDNYYNKVVISSPKYSDKEIKNSLVLIVGAVLIIISAILFLTTKWDVTNNLFKTLIIVLMLIVFFSASFVADRVLNLKTTAKAFYYIGLAYLPIVFLSISLFSLFGKFFSLYGLGKYIYLTVCSLITTYVYYLNAKSKNSKLLSVATVVFSIISVILFALIFSHNPMFIMLLLAIYLLILNLLYRSSKYVIYKELHLKSITTLLFSLIIVIFYYYSIFNLNINNVMIKDIILDFVMFYNIYFYINVITNKKYVYEYIYPTLVILIIFHFSFLFSSIIVKQLLIICSFILLYIYDLIKKSVIQILTFFNILIAGVILYLFTIYNISKFSYCIPSYIILLVLGFLALINYFYKENKYVYPAYYFNSIVIFSIFDFLVNNSLSLIYLGYSALFMLGITIIFKFKEQLKKSLLLIGNISFILSSFINYDNNIFLVMLYIVYSIVNFIIYYREKLDIYKIISYIYINISLLFLINLLHVSNTNLLFYVVPFTTIIFILMEYFIKELNSDNNHYYIYIQIVISLLLLNIVETSLLNFIFLVFFNFLYFFYVTRNKWNNNFLYVCYISLIPYVYIKNLPLFYNVNYMYLVSIGLLSLFCYLIYTKKEDMYVILFSIFTFFHLIHFDESKYVCLLIISIGTFLTYLIKAGKKKDILRGLLYTYVLIFFKFVLYDFDLEDISFLHYGIYFLWVLVITRTIIKKYNGDNSKVLEYFSYVIINLLSIFNYSSEMDGILFVFLLTFFVIFGYVLKLGPIFIVSLVSILVNVLLLTRTFWLSIPWWLYILLIGSILISFSIYNEISIKNDKKSVINIINTIKNKLNL